MNNMLSGIIASLLGGLGNYFHVPTIREVVKQIGDNDFFWSQLQKQSDELKKLINS